ncbi:hypothetical protein QEV65_09760 [Trueperella pyogenes]|uniref:hypothetical protein n=1 Tax=Trueperella pyogenes TaxID=1661 RepID=UPI00324702C6
MLNAVSAKIFAIAMSATAFFPGTTTEPGTPISSALTNESGYTALNLDPLDDFLRVNGVEKDTRANLLDNLKNGGSWDSATRGKEPIAIKHISDGAWKTSIYTFEDGSIRVTRVSREDDETSQGVQLRNVHRCTLASSSTYHSSYTGCVAEDSNGLITLGFPFNYTRFKGGAGRIDAIGSGYKTVFAGSLTIGGTYIGQKQGNPAWAQTYGTYHGTQEWMERDVRVTVKVNSNGAYTESNLSLW